MKKKLHKRILNSEGGDSGYQPAQGILVQTADSNCFY
jgi:hypothetical protein